MAPTKSKSSPKKSKRMRVSFSIPKIEYAAIDALKTQAVALGTTVKKSGLLRAGLMALQGMNDAAFKRALASVPTRKTSPPGITAEDKAAGAPPAPTPRRPARKAAVKAPAKAAPAAAASKRAAVKKTPAKG